MFPARFAQQKAALKEQCSSEIKSQRNAQRYGAGRRHAVPLHIIAHLFIFLFLLALLTESKELAHGI